VKHQKERCIFNFQPHTDKIQKRFTQATKRSLSERQGTSYEGWRPLKAYLCIIQFFSVALVHFSHHYLHLHNS